MTPERLAERENQHFLHDHVDAQGSVYKQRIPHCLACDLFTALEEALAYNEVGWETAKIIERANIALQRRVEGLELDQINGDAWCERAQEAEQQVKTLEKENLGLVGTLEEFRAGVARDTALAALRSGEPK